jgi:cell division protein FtsW (lipid II flippase)
MRYTAVFSALGIHILLLLMEPDIFAVGVQLLCLFFLAFACKGGKPQRAAFGSLPFFFCVAAAIYIFSRPDMQERVKIWLSPFKYAARENFLMKAFESAGLWGLGCRAARESWLAAPQDSSLTALPYLSLLWGNVAIALCVLLLMGVLALLFLRLSRLGGPHRNVALGIWLFLLFNQLWGIGMSFGLLPLTDSYGAAFIGNSDMGCLMLLLGIFTSFRQESEKQPPD